MVPNTEIAIADQAGNFKSPITMRGIGSAITAILGYRKENCPFMRVKCSPCAPIDYRIEITQKGSKIDTGLWPSVNVRFCALCCTQVKTAFLPKNYGWLLVSDISSGNEENSVAW